jgi:hypothetical protein
MRVALWAPSAPKATSMSADGPKARQQGSDPTSSSMLFASATHDADRRVA